MCWVYYKYYIYITNYPILLKLIFVDTQKTDIYKINKRVSNRQ